MTINIATRMLEDSAKAIADRQSKYGPPNRNFKNIAALWQAWLRARYGELATITIDEADVASMSDLIKTARLAETPDHEDSWIDKAGYAACGRQVTASKGEAQTYGHEEYRVSVALHKGGTVCGPNNPCDWPFCPACYPQFTNR